MGTPVTTYIASLLYQHDYVVIPGFGGFVARKIPATFHENGFAIYPPRKEVIFNPDLTADDGLLVQKMAGELEMPLEKAAQLIHSETKDWTSQLKAGEGLFFDGLGIIKLNLNGKPEFTQFVHTNFLVDSFGLKIAKAKPVRQRQTVRPRVTRPQTDKIIIERLPVKYKRFQKASLAAIVILSVSATYLYLLSFNTAMMDKAGLNFFELPVIDSIEIQTLEANKLEEAPAEKAADKVEEETTKTTSITPAPDTIKEEEAIEKAEEEEDESESVEKGRSKQFHVIVSSLQSVDRLDVEIKKYRLKGYDPIIIPEDGIYRISICNFASRDSAYTFKKNIYNDNNIESWILPK